MMNPHHSKRYVLYADDDPDDLDYVRESFAEHAPDMEVITFGSAIDMLKFVLLKEAEGHLPCLVIMDINMPRLSGTDALKVLRGISRYDEVPAVLFTTSRSPQDEHFAARYNAGFISKPLNGEQMNIIVEKFLEHCREGARAGG